MVIEPVLSAAAVMPMERTSANAKTMDKSFFICVSPSRNYNGAKGHKTFSQKPVRLLNRDGDGCDLHTFCADHIAIGSAGNLDGTGDGGSIIHILGGSGFQSAGAAFDGNFHAGVLNGSNGHGDLHLIVLAPNSIQEAADYTSLAFELGDKYRVPVMMLADGALGQMMEPVEFKEVAETALPEKPWATTGTGCKRKKNIINSLFIKPDELEVSVNERFDRYAEIEKNETRAEEYMTEDADIVIVSYGITSRICKTAITLARKEGLKVGMVRPITLWPYPSATLANVAKTAKEFLVVELNKGQMVDDVKISIECSRPVSFYGRTGGMMPTPEEILEELRKIGGRI